jgi:hypothetical protein
MADNEIVKLNRIKTSNLLMDWSGNINICACSLRLLLEGMESQEDECQASLIILVTECLERINKEIAAFDTNHI